MPGDGDVVLLADLFEAAGSTHLAHGSEMGVVSNYHCACVGSFPADDFAKNWWSLAHQVFPTLSSFLWQLSTCSLRAVSCTPQWPQLRLWDQTGGLHTSWGGVHHQGGLGLVTVDVAVRPEALPGALLQVGPLPAAACGHTRVGP